MKRLAMVFSLILVFLAVPTLLLAQQASTGKPAAGAAVKPAPGAGGQAGQEHAGHGQAQGMAAGQDQGHQGHGGGMMGKCKEMMAKHDEAKAEWKAMDDRLNEKIGAMNAAKGDQRMEAMAAVINEMADQRTKMREMFMSMHGQGGMMAKCMGGGMGGHGGGGMMGGRGGMMGGRGGGMMGGHGDTDSGGGMGGMCADCPMMKGHGGAGHGAAAIPEGGQGGHDAHGGHGTAAPGGQAGTMPKSGT